MKLLAHAEAAFKNSRDAEAVCALRNRSKQHFDFHSFLSFDAALNILLVDRLPLF